MHFTLIKKEVLLWNLQIILPGYLPLFVFSDINIKS